MKETKIIKLTVNGAQLVSADFSKLDVYYKTGWYYKDSIVQPVSSSTPNILYGVVCIVLERDIIDISED